jgi:uncharacterized membrane protein
LLLKKRVRGAVLTNKLQTFPPFNTSLVMFHTQGVQLEQNPQMSLWYSFYISCCGLFFCYHAGPTKKIQNMLYKHSVLQYFIYLLSRTGGFLNLEGKLMSKYLLQF